MAALLQSVGWGTGLGASSLCAALCLLGGGMFTRDAAVIAQLHAVVGHTSRLVPACAQRSIQS